MTEVKIGQLWRDNDGRLKAPGIIVRFIRVERIEGEYAYCLSNYNTRDWKFAKKVRIRLNRFRPNSTGYRLVRDA